MVLLGRAVFLALGAAVFIALFATLAPARSAYAQEPPEAVDGSIIVFKVCEGAEEGDDPFDIDVHFEFDGAGVADPPNFTLDCGDFEEFEIGGELADLFEYLTANPLDDASVSITEVNVPSYVDVSYDDCEIDRDALEALADNGVVCVITNEFDIPDLTISKVCPNGGAGTTFNVLVRRGSLASGELLAGKNLTCGGSFEVEDLEPGTYRIQEVISGANAANFITSIACVDASGQSVVQRLFETVTLEFGTSAQCAIFNFLNGAPAAAPTVAPVVINNTNTNVINNTNANTNANANTNTQTQANEQTQVNDNNQTTTVDSGPSVNISGVPRPQAVAPVAPAAAAPITTLRGPSTGNGGLISPPRTGDAGLADTGSDGWAYLVVFGGVAGAAALTTLRFRGTRS